MDRLTRLELDLKNLLKEVDELTLNDEGEEREDISLEEYAKIEEKETELRDLKKMIEGERKLRGMKDELSQPQPEPAPEQEQVEPEPNRGFETFGHYLQAVIRASIPPGAEIGGQPTGRIDPRLREIRATGLSEGIPADGGFLLQTQYMDELVRKIHQTGKLASRCRQIAISPKVSSLKIPGVDESSRADGSRYGGIRAYWTAEAAEKTASKPKFRNITLEPQKLTGLVYLTDELIQDVSALGTFVSDIMTEEFGFKIDDAIINGTGAGQPLGILNANALVTVSKEAGQAATTIVAENIEKMYARLWSKSLSNAVWLINQDCWPQIFQLHHAVGTGGVPMFIPAAGLPNTPAGTLFNRPIVPIEQCQTLGTKGDIYFVDLNQYYIATKGAMQSAMSIHVRFIYDESVMRFVYRLDGQPIWNVALTPFKGSNTQSPYVTLAART